MGTWRDRGKAVIRTEDIYDAATDDGAFDRLASTLADAVGARSGVLHWGRTPQHVAEISYSGYFTDAQMALYDEEFQDDDIWGVALDRAEAVNRVWNVEALVPTHAYEGSRIYNEWIKGMGDDTFRCLGGVIRKDGTTGHIGLHRGRTQKPFNEDEVRAMQDSIDHIGRMFAIRSKLDRANHYGRSLHATLDMVGHAVFTLRANGALIDCNRMADALLRRGDALSLRQRQLKARDPRDDEALQAAFRAATARQGGQASAIFVHRERGAPYVLSIAAVRVGMERQIVAIATDPADRDQSLASRIRSLYGLTRAEAEVAEALCQGRGLEDLSQERGVALNTVRTQIKNIYVKLDCSRQSELVARIGALPRLSGFENME
ncbi:helix-turn-helix transcriptional regulator [Sphingobium fuliginis]|jgi:DNA-binding CsgD family transcriptional regulator|uniref:Helix-turn-helix transcriptional regulator n=1 Tax=Sphingobium fuliginis (strain ATCC 27551) TaxID=336203 RepID=A0A7M2GG72_SPHSA|nr:helix-turn-helix transcriptional regulator [Sphingobium fuliginis]